MIDDRYIRDAMAAAARRKLAENEASKALDSLPHDLPVRGPWCPDYGARRDPRDPAYLATLAQLGMRIDEDGRYRITAPELNNTVLSASAGWRRWCDGVR